MKLKAKAKSRLLETVREGGRDLHEAGLISQRRMREIEALCRDAIPAARRRR